MTGGFTASETSILGYHRAAEFRRAGLLNMGAATAHCADLMERYDVRPRRPQQIAVQFSGGNQQKLVMARETDAGPRVILIGQPTRGVDIGAIEFIHREIVRLRDAGCAIMVGIGGVGRKRCLLADRISGHVCRPHCRRGRWRVR